ncbi:hypothetical protein [Dendronalium sp. ChiSLP03b]|uniref:hypothetical protein n=1 Tax=Dendronalium sp. ChiSLP03b TaxID=3075381 RepID=UPI003918815C
MNETLTESNISPESLELAKAFKTKLGNFHWNSDYFKFCSVMGWEPSDYAEDKWRRFEELISTLNEFDDKSTARMLEAGK